MNIEEGRIVKKHSIITATDKKYGDFLIEEWLTSIRENVNLSNIDVAVIDYGLSVAQRYWLQRHGVKTLRGERDGHVAVIRYREISGLLSEYPYDQVLVCDSGDLIIQSDISHLFESDKGTFRAVCEDAKPAFAIFLKKEYFSKSDKKKITECFLRNEMINAGFILGPREKMKWLCDMCNKTIRIKNKFGPDQLVVNYALHTRGFKRLDKGYNFVIATSREDVTLENGKFFFPHGEPIPVVHNAGNLRFLRPVGDFGYGKGHNVLRKEVYAALKAFHRSSDSVLKSTANIDRSREALLSIIKKVKHPKRRVQGKAVIKS